MCNKTMQTTTNARDFAKQRKITRRCSDSEQLKGRLNRSSLKQHMSGRNIAATSMCTIDGQDKCTRRNSFG